MMEHIGMFDPKARFSEIVRMVRATGRRVIVTDRGEELVEIAPVRASEESRRSSTAAFDEIDQMRRERGRSTAAENRAAIEEGRQ